MRMISLARTRTALVGIGIFAAAVSMTAGADASVTSSAALTWSVVPSPSRGTDSLLGGVSCVSATACTAAGDYATSGGPGRTLIESWNGTKWSVVPSPNRGGSNGGSVLYGVSCVSATACTVAGAYIHTSTSGGIDRTLIESWNGTNWSVVPSPNRAGANGGSVLDGVSCASATACTAVGSDTHTSTSGSIARTLIESWNGTSWSVTPSPSPGTDSELNSVSCTTATTCTAVGVSTSASGARVTLAESWNGASWSVMPIPEPGADSWLEGVSCVSATACTAAGFYYTTGGGHHMTLIESWNGASWSVVPSPSPGTGSLFSGVSCVSATVCSAAGYYNPTGSTRGTLIETWNGTSWSVVPSPGRGSHSALDGVSCVSATACSATGYYPAGGQRKTLIESGTANG